MDRKEEARRLIRHHLSAATRHGTGTPKYQQHVDAARYLADQHSISIQHVKAIPPTDPPPRVNFGRDGEALARRQEHQRAEQQKFEEFKRR